MADKKLRWTLQIFWDGEWRTLFGSDKRIELARYIEECPKDLELRIIDSLEEEVKARARRH
jgi:hypothetical protein